MTDGRTAHAEPMRRAPRWLLAALFASLALNLVVVGLVAGAIWRFRAPVWAPITPSLLGYASALPPERRKQLWEQTAEERAELRPLRREVRAARDETVQALVAEPFDRQVFLAAQARQYDAEQRARHAMQGLYLKIAEGLTPEERRAFPRWREHRRPAGHNLLDGPDHQAEEAQSHAVGR
jgi:uncharacterized membrane protein